MAWFTVGNVVTRCWFSIKVAISTCATLSVNSTRCLSVNAFAADPIDAQVVDAFFQAFSPLELDLYERTLATQQAADEQIDQAQQQQLARLRYEVALAERQFKPGRPG